MQTRPTRADRREVGLRRLVAGFLRMAPDVAIVGEVRDRKALPLLLTLSSGVKGYTTIHAGSARQALTRLRFVCQLADTVAELPLSALNTLVSESVDLVVHCARRDGKPQVPEILAVEDLQTGPDAAAFTTTELFRRQGPGGPATSVESAATMPRQRPLPRRSRRRMRQEHRSLTPTVTTTRPAEARSTPTMPTANVRTTSDSSARSRPASTATRPRCSKRDSCRRPTSSRPLDTSGFGFAS